LNNCSFIGFFTEKPHLDQLNGVSYVNFDLEIISYRKTKTGEKAKSSVFLPFEAYHTGAETIAKMARAGSKIMVSCSARTWSDDDGYETVIFRVNEFDFSCPMENNNNEEKSSFLQ
jgi:single-stranded DNA-binding protein